MSDSIFKGRLYRDSCIETIDGFYLKDLRVIEDRALKDIILVDNCIYSFVFQPNNGIPIFAYYDQPRDTELKSLLQFLMELSNVGDIREILKDYFRLEDIMKSKNIAEAKGIFGFL